MVRRVNSVTEPGPMTHERARAELSARFDGEQSDELSATLAEHLADCASCRQWQRSAQTVTTLVRQAPVPVPPDRTEELLAAVLADQAPRRHTRRRLLLQARAGLAAVAAGQFVLIVPALVFGNAGGGTPVQASHELGAFNLALAVGFIVAALRPSLARGMLPLAGVASATLFVLAFVDSALGHTTLKAEAPHLITILGSLLLFALVRAGHDTAGRRTKLSGPNRLPKGFRGRGMPPGPQGPQRSGLASDA